MNIKTKYLRMPKNFMTPNVEKFEQIGDRVVELAFGFGISNTPIWGVSEFKEADTRFGLESTGRGQVFDNRKEAQKHYSLLKMQ